MKMLTFVQNRTSIVAGTLAVIIGVPSAAHAVVQWQTTENPIPKEFCIDGTLWASSHDVPAVAREYDMGERFTRGNQALFHPNDVRSVILVDAQSVNDGDPVQTHDTERAIAIQESRAETGSGIRWLAWFFVPRYDAFVVEPTHKPCEGTESDLFFGRVAEQGALEPTGRDGLQFIVEPNASLASLLGKNPGRE